MLVTEVLSHWDSTLDDNGNSSQIKEGRMCKNVVEKNLITVGIHYSFVSQTK